MVRMTIYLLALAMCVVAGLRAMTVPAAVSWGAHVPPQFIARIVTGALGGAAIGAGAGSWLAGLWAAA